MKTNLTEYLEEQVAICAEKTAVSDENTSVTFKELQSIAYNISDCIIKKNDNCNNIPIILFIEKNVSLYCSIMGVLYSGNYYVPIDTKMPIDRMNLIFSNLNPKLAITVPKLYDKLKECGFEGEIISFDIEEYRKRPLIKNEDNYISNIIDTDPAYVLFTSGSTGIPKGVTISHRAVIDYVEWQKKYIKIDHNNILGNQAPFFFDASMPDIYTPLVTGASLVIIPEKLFLFPSKLIDFINKNKIDTLIWVPSALILISSDKNFGEKKIDNLKIVMFCGEIMPVKHLNKWRKYYPKTKYINMYGPTEAAYACTYFPITREFSDDQILPIGKPCENTGIIVLDKNNSVIKDKNIVGELCIRGSCLANGYYNDKNKTDEAFMINPVNNKYNELIYRTGDLVKYNEYMELEYVGRKDFQIKHNGYRIELGEIESVVYGISEIEKCCVLYNEDEKEIVLFCVTNMKVSEKIIMFSLMKSLPKYMLPSKIIFLDDIPLNANGKIDRKKLKQLF